MPDTLFSANSALQSLAYFQKCLNSFHQSLAIFLASKGDDPLFHFQFCSPLFQSEKIYNFFYPETFLLA